MTGLRRARVHLVLISLALVLSGLSHQRAQADGYVPGETYYGRNEYIEYIAGDLPIVLSAPHGGYLKPSEIPDRTWGVTGVDTRTQELTRELGDYIEEQTGRRPHIIINRLARIKLDANRDLNEAAQGNPYAEQAWREFHAFIEDAKAAIGEQCGRGHYFDIHCNEHEAKWVEMGLMLGSSDLNRSDESLDSDTYKDKSSLKSLAYTPGIDFPEVVRGESSLGGLLQAYGYKSVPSPVYPHPDGSAYFTGGYNTARHGSRDGGAIDGTQVETYWEMLKDDRRESYVHALGDSIIAFVETHYGFDLSRASKVCPTFVDVSLDHWAYDYIETLYQEGYTAGCSTDPLMYCPDQTMNRAESAVFVERGIHGTDGLPSQPTTQTFADLPLDSWAAKWGEALWQDHYTAGCGTDPLVYCPWQGHTRAEGCVFYLHMLNGATYEPPQPSQQTFADVPLETWYAKWVQAAYDAGLIEACQTTPELRFCPNDPLLRALAAYMMVRAKGIPLP